VSSAPAGYRRLINTYRREFPAAMACFEDDLDALLAIHRVRVRHRIRCAPQTWPNDPSSRNAAAPRSSVASANERSAMKLVFATMIRAAER
jgi:hypothetical protein